jgi:alpha-D-xyloside xylohydrolase
VQDWQYWPLDSWGSHAFDASRFPDPSQWVKDVHARNARLMISVWGKYYPTTENARAMRAKGYLYEPPLAEGLKDWLGFPYTFYDAYNPGARAAFWDQINRSLLSGVDGGDDDRPDISSRADPPSKRLRTPPRWAPRPACSPTAVNSQASMRAARGRAEPARVHPHAFAFRAAALLGRHAVGRRDRDVDRVRRRSPRASPDLGLLHWTTDSGAFAVPPRWATDTMTDAVARSGANSVAVVPVRDLPVHAHPRPHCSGSRGTSRPRAPVMRPSSATTGCATACCLRLLAMP